jgi:transposase InsO family protein
MTLEDSILAFRLRVMARAEELKNVTAGCREMGISGTLFYRWRRRFERYGRDGLHLRRRQARPGRPSQVPPHVARLVVGQAPAWPTGGCRRVSLQLARDLGGQLSPSPVQRIVRRALQKHHNTGPCGLLTERTRRQLARARGPWARHVHAALPGERVCLDTFSIGKLNGVGRVWQITAGDAACSSGVAWGLPAFSADATAGFLREILAPPSRRASGPLRRVLTDGGSAFKGPFEETCRALGIRHTRTQPRHAWTNGFVERLQGTILHEHWRIEFRRRYFTSRAAMQRSFDAFMRFYNERRPHQGYRVNGHTPAELFWGVVSAPD